MARLRLFNIPSIFSHYLNWFVAPNICLDAKNVVRNVSLMDICDIPNRSSCGHFQQLSTSLMSPSSRSFAEILEDAYASYLVLNAWNRTLLAFWNLSQKIIADHRGLTKMKHVNKATHRCGERVIRWRNSVASQLFHRWVTLEWAPSQQRNVSFPSFGLHWNLGRVRPVGLERL